jgi:hypothetical protein
MQFHEPCTPVWLNIGCFSVSSSVACLSHCYIFPLWTICFKSQFCLDMVKCRLCLVSPCDPVADQWSLLTLRLVLRCWCITNFYEVFRYFIVHRLPNNGSQSTRTESSTSVGSWCFLVFHSEQSFECETESRWMSCPINEWFQVVTWNPIESVNKHFFSVLLLLLVLPVVMRIWFDW